MYLDLPSTATVENLWRTLDRAGLSTPLHAGEARPHVSLAACGELDVTAFEVFLREFAATQPELPITFTHVAAFETVPAVVYLALESSPDLLALHQRMHSQLQSYARLVSPYYRPGTWVPHCTLAERIPLGDVQPAFEACASIRLPLHAWLQEVGVVEYPPIRQYYAHRFTSP